MLYVFVKTITYHPVCFDHDLCMGMQSFILLSQTSSMIANTGLQVYDAINEDSKLPNIEYPDTDASKAIIEFHACKYQAIIWFDPLNLFSLFLEFETQPTSIQEGVELNCFVTDLHLRSSRYGVFQPNACIS